MKSRFLIGFVLCTLVFTSSLIPTSLVYGEEGNTTTPNTVQPKEEKKDPLKILKDYAHTKGEEYGKMFASRDHIMGLSDKADRHFSDAASVYSYFKMNSDTSEHKQVFYNAFIAAYRYAYQEASMELRTKDLENNELYWFKVAEEAGKVEGTISAYYDHLNEHPLNWELAYKRFVENESLSERFRLKNFSSNLPKNFELDFKQSFKTTYKEAFARAIVEENQRNTNYFYVDAEGNNIVFQRDYAEVSKSSQGSKPMAQIEAIFPKRCILERTPIALRYKQHVGKKVQPYLIPLSDIYELELQREVRSVEFHEEPTLKIAGYAVRGAGIYKWNKGRWDYIMTTIADKELLANLPKGNYTNTEFAVFIDDSYVTPTDISFSWAFKEIYTYMRRHNIPSVEKFYPDQKITRVDLADILYRTMGHRVKHNPSNTYIADEGSFTYGQAAARFCVDMGYINLDYSANFNPKDKVSYFEFQTMMKKLAPSYSLDDHVNKQLNEKFYRSDLFTKKDENISRSEVVYALYTYLD